MRTAKTPIRLGGCPGLSESSLGAQSLCWFCHVAAHMYLMLNLCFTLAQCNCIITENKLSKTCKPARTGHPRSLHEVFFRDVFGKFTSFTGNLRKL